MDPIATRSDHKEVLVQDGAVLLDRQKSKGAMASPMKEISASRLCATCTTELPRNEQPGSHGRNATSKVPMTMAVDLKSPL